MGVLRGSGGRNVYIMVLERGKTMISEVSKGCRRKTSIS